MVTFHQLINRVGLFNCLLASYLDFRQSFLLFCPFRLKFNSYFISFQRFLLFWRFPDVIELWFRLDLISIRFKLKCGLKITSSNCHFACSTKICQWQSSFVDWYILKDRISPFQSQNWRSSSFIWTFWMPLLSTNGNHRTSIPLPFVNQLWQICAQGQITDLYKLIKKLPLWGQVSDCEISLSDFSEDWEADWTDSWEDIAL
jgi:hypothetical protein